jgi:hypothetical protein
MPWHVEPPPLQPFPPPPGGSKVFSERTSSNLTFPDHWWDERHWKELQKAERYRPALAGIGAKLILPDDTKLPDEVRVLREFQESPERERRRAEILDEAVRPPPYYKHGLFMDDIRRPLTAAVFQTAVSWSVPFIMYFKHQWKRPRPSQVDPAISPMIECPHHPAFPSGHSTQAHLVALVIGSISGRTDVRDTLWEKAHRIAQNREYAGLHYASDSACGIKLAEALYPLFETEHAGAMYAARQREWDLWP